MGIIAFIVDALVESMVHFKWEMTRNVIKDTGLGAAWMVFLLISVFYAALASSMTVYIGPGAMGSGIAAQVANAGIQAFGQTQGMALQAQAQIEAAEKQASAQKSAGMMGAIGGIAGAGLKLLTGGLA